MAKRFADEGACPRFGCASIPLVVNHTFDWFGDTFCLPLSFAARGPDETLAAQTAAAQMPPPPPPSMPDGSLVKSPCCLDVFYVEGDTAVLPSCFVPRLLPFSRCTDPLSLPPAHSGPSHLLP